jgi:hypothetical protein
MRLRKWSKAKDRVPADDWADNIAIIWHEDDTTHYEGKEYIGTAAERIFQRKYGDSSIVTNCDRGDWIAYLHEDGTVTGAYCGQGFVGALFVEDRR